MKEHLGACYDKTSDFQQAQFGVLCELIRDHVPDRAAVRKLVDIGSGSGARTHQCLKLFSAIEKIWAIEPDWEMIATAREKYADPRIDYILSPAEKMSSLNLPPSGVDAFLSNWALHWVEDKDTMMADIVRALRPGGYMMFSTCERLPTLLVMIDSYVRNEFKITGGKSPFHYLNAAEWKDLLARHGLEVVGVSKYPVGREVESTSKYLEHWFTASTAKFMYGKHLVELSPWAHSDLLLTRTSAGRGIALQIGIYMPIIGRLITVAALARFSENLAGLYSGGIDLRRGLKTAAEITEPASLRRQLQAAAQQVAAGKPLDVAFHNVTGIDSMALAMLRTGERSGNLSLTLQEVVLYYDQQVDAALTALRQYTGPVLIVGLGYILYRYF